MGGVITQIFPPSPTFTEKNLASLVGKVFIVTGGNAGVGLELVKILYSKGATVYIASRSPAKITAEIDFIKSTYKENSGHIKSLPLDLGDLNTISKCVSTFLAQESRLDVLWHNAGISQAPIGSTTVQGHEAHIGTNCLGAFLLIKLLLSVLRRTAEISPKGSVRVVFTSSGIIDMNGPPGGVSLAEYVPDNFSKDKNRNYSASKAGNWFLASEFNKRIRKDGIICVTQSPGTLKTKAWDRAPRLMKWSMWPVMHEPIMGAYTELWAGLSPEVKPEDGGRYAIPWGRWHTSPRRDILESLKTKQEGGTGLAAEFWDWCEEKTKEYATIKS